MLAPMKPELKAIVKSFALSPTSDDPVFSHAGTAGRWEVAALVTGMGPALAREATRRALAAGPFDHVMVIGIAGGLDPGLPVGSLMVPGRVQLYPDGSGVPSPSASFEGNQRLVDDHRRPVRQRRGVAADPRAGVRRGRHGGGGSGRGVRSRRGRLVRLSGHQRPPGRAHRRPGRLFPQQAGRLRRSGRRGQVSRSRSEASQGPRAPEPMHAGGGQHCCRRRLRRSDREVNPRRRRWGGRRACHGGR